MRSLLTLLLLVTGLLTLTGCNTFERRADKKAATFATLDEPTKSRLQAGEVRVGDNEDMVYLALGSPDEKKSTTTAKDKTTTWIYNRYWQEYRGEAYGGFARRVVRDPKTGTTTAYLEPISRPVYSDHVQPVMKITFADGKVTVVERAKN
ncbi:MAG: hypothetical protein WC205_19210 [Opitutaceae bacterium]|jgi:hypothetical protein